MIATLRDFHIRGMRGGQADPRSIVIGNISRTARYFHQGTPTPFLMLDDPSPLEGAGHEYFAFNNWETDTWFDNLTITPL